MPWTHHSVMVLSLLSSLSILDVRQSGATAISRNKLMLIAFCILATKTIQIQSNHFNLSLEIHSPQRLPQLAYFSENKTLRWEMFLTHSEGVSKFAKSQVQYWYQYHFQCLLTGNCGVLNLQWLNNGLIIYFQIWRGADSTHAGMLAIDIQLT